MRASKENLMLPRHSKELSSDISVIESKSAVLRLQNSNTNHLELKISERRASISELSEGFDPQKAGIGKLATEKVSSFLSKQTI